MTTKRQKDAVKFCEYWGFPKFNGDIENFAQVSTYLSKYLNEAKSLKTKSEEKEKWEDFMINCGNIGFEDIY